MEPIAAVSLVATICQLIDFSSKIISNTIEISTSASNSLTVDNELSQAASQISNLSEKLKPGFTSDEITPTSTCYTRDEQALAEICKSCNDVAVELTDKLDKLRSNEDRIGWKSFRKAIRHAWSEKELLDLSRRLSMLRGTLELNVLVNLRQNLETHVDDFSEGLREIARIATTLEENQTSASRDLQDHTIAITQVLSECEATNEHLHQETRESIIQAISEMGSPSGRRASIQKFPGLIPALKVAERHVILACENKVLKGLTFSTLTDRYEEVEKAHLQTFEWIFERRPLKAGQYAKKAETNKWSNFVNWLRMGQGIYWVNGKAASGKSTLMRYIYDHGQTQTELCAWSKDVSLGTAGFFFWLSGTAMQKSQLGLLRGLLHEILRQHRKLIPVVFPEEWDDIHTQIIGHSTVIDDFAPTLAKVKRAFMLLVKQNIIPLKVCLFVDGLDEYDDNHEDIAEFLSSITSWPNVKACISSRPLLVYEDAFRGLPSLRLQDLTFQDIEIYTTESLQNNSKFKKLAIDEPEKASILIQEIVTKADGVFLWVRLVVKSLLAGLRNRDDFSVLEQRLLALPADLELLYVHMLKVRIEPVYESQSSQIFQLVHGVYEPHTTISLALALDERLQKSLYTRETLLDDAEILEMCEIMSDRLKSRCAGLLEVRGAHQESGQCGTVQFMHRTVKDFLEVPQTWSFILAATAQTDFKPHKLILKSILLRYKLVPRKYVGSDLFATAIQGLRSGQEACSYPDDPHDSLELLLNTLNSTLNAEYSENSFLRSDPPHWSGLVDLEHPRQWPDSFTSAAVRYGLLTYVEQQLDKRKELLLNKTGRPLLDYAIYINRCTIAVSLSRTRDMAILLLRAGADPNQEFNGSTVWQNFLISATAETHSNDQLVILLEIQEELVAFGATFVGVVKTVSEQYRWCKMIHSLWHRLDQARTGRIVNLIQRRAHNGSILQQTLLDAPLSPLLLPPSRPLTPQSPSINAVGPTGTVTPLQDEACTRSDGGSSELKRERSFSRRIRGWRKRK